MATQLETPPSAASRLFDLRVLIGGLFVVYGIMLTVAGFFTSASQKAKASGINMNLWLGIGMLVLGILFLIWARTKPIKIEPNPVVDDADRLPPTRRPHH
jgi:ABC-type transport system involved in multi-copper enzyme maturation permease subunit